MSGLMEILGRMRKTGPTTSFEFVRSGVIDLDKTLADLGIDDEPPLTAEEKQATVRDCLKARSGVFHTAEAEAERVGKNGRVRPFLFSGGFPDSPSCLFQ